MFLSRDDGTLYNLGAATFFMDEPEGPGLRVSWPGVDLYLIGEEARLVRGYLEALRGLVLVTPAEPQPADLGHVTGDEACS